MTLNATDWVVTVADGAGDTRLDRFLATAAATRTDDAEPLSRARLQALIEAGAVVRLSGGEAGDAITLPRHLVRVGEMYRVQIPTAVAPEPAGEAIALAIVHEDRDLIVIDKPAGLVVHPAAGHDGGTLVNALIAHCGDSLSGIGGVRRPGIVHRLDKDTSGLLVVAKTDRAHQSLADQFRLHGTDGRLVRRYLALVWGAPERPSGRIDAALARSRTNRTKIAVVRDDSGRHAVTHFEVAARYRPDAKGRALAGLLRLTLETGRTHQIRVHLAHIGHPVMGDATYGSSHTASARRLDTVAAAALSALGRQALHAAELGFEHPRSGKTMHFTSPPPADIEALRQALAANVAPDAVPVRDRRSR